MKISDRSFSIVLVAALLSTACAKKEQTAQSDDEWPEMESFHSVMAGAYHPFADSANLQPVKTMAEDMAREAEKWAAAPLPQRLNAEDTKSKLEKLKKDTRALADQIKAGSGDKEIGDALTALHKEFHEIMEVWRGN
jgi:hypothetical protein